MKPPASPMRILRMLFWETTVRCNLACAHCRRLESNDAGVADLSTSQGEALIDQLAELGRRQQRFEGVPPSNRGRMPATRKGKGTPNAINRVWEPVMPWPVTVQDSHACAGLFGR